MNLASSYDIIVVGGGPAGCMAAWAAAKENVSVLLLEKDRELGTPVRCAEAVGKDGLENIIGDTVDPRWITAKITKFQFVSPDGTVVYPQVKGVGYVLNRKVFDNDLGMRAANAGARIIVGAMVNGVLHEDGHIRGVTCIINGEQKEVRAKLVIAADGVESRVARWAGINTTVALRDMETCSQMTLANLPIADDTCIFYFSQKQFPQGYGWLFPKGNGTANVGLGVSALKARYHSPDALLQKFVETNFPQASILHKTVGGVPCANRLPKLTGNGIMLAGDAGHQTNPVSGGGISTGMTAGKLAGAVGAEAVKKNNTSAAGLIRYEKDWDKQFGNAQKRYYRLKEGISKLDDTQLNRTAHRLKDLPVEKQTLIKIFKTALIHQPALLVDILKTLNIFS